MARKLRIQSLGAIYHVMNRGDRREDIFEDDQDRLRFLETLGEACEKTGFQIHAYCLMRNHFHLVVETPQANLVAGMKWFLGTYTSRYHRRHKEFKPVERGWFLGEEAFRQALLEQVQERPGPSHFGEAVQAGAEAQAERWIERGLQQLKWSQEELASRPKGDAGKVRLAMELRRQTTVPLAWIAQRLQMGSRGYAAWLLQQVKRKTLADHPDQGQLAI